MRVGTLLRGGKGCESECSTERHPAMQLIVMITSIRVLKECYLGAAMMESKQLEPPSGSGQDTQLITSAAGTSKHPYDQMHAHHHFHGWKATSRKSPSSIASLFRTWYTLFYVTMRSTSQAYCSVRVYTKCGCLMKSRQSGGSLSLS